MRDSGNVNTIRDMPHFEHGCGIEKKSDIRNKLTSRPNDGGSSECRIPVKNKRNARMNDKIHWKR